MMDYETAPVRAIMPINHFDESQGKQQATTMERRAYEGTDGELTFDPDITPTDKASVPMSYQRRAGVRRSRSSESLGGSLTSSTSKSASLLRALPLLISQYRRSLGTTPADKWSP